MLHFINRCNDLIRHDMSCVCARKKLEDVAKTQGCIEDGVCLELLKCMTAVNEDYIHHRQSRYSTVVGQVKYSRNLAHVRLAFDAARECSSSVYVY